MKQFKPSADPEMAEFEAALLRSLDQVRQGAGRVTTPEQIMARRAGRPSGSVKPNPKASTTIRFDADVLAALRASGAGWQTRVSDAVRELVKAGRL